MTRLRPTFELDDKGRPICLDHPNYPEFVDPTMDFFQDFSLDARLTCKTCTHHENDDCYFAKARIDEIDDARRRNIIGNPFRCALCGNKIQILFSIMYKLMLEESQMDQDPSVEIPLICCNCLESIHKNEFLRECAKKIVGSLEVILLGLFLAFFSHYTFHLSGSTLLFFFSLLLSVPVNLYAAWRLRKIFFAAKGWRTYKKFFK